MEKTNSYFTLKNEKTLRKNFKKKEEMLTIDSWTKRTFPYQKFQYRQAQETIINSRNNYSQPLNVNQKILGKNINRTNRSLW